jgi:hypothetical protein
VAIRFQERRAKERLVATTTTSTKEDRSNEQRRTQRIIKEFLERNQTWNY